MSWIHLEDLISLFVFCLNDARLSGAVNGVAPYPVTNREFSKCLGAVLNKPAIFAAPKIALKLALGEMASVVLASQKVRPDAATQAGFRFRFEDINQALRDVSGGDGAKDKEELVVEQWIPQNVDKVFPFFSEAKNLEALTPEWLNFKLLRQSTAAITQNTLLDYQLKLHGFPVKWQSKIEDWVPGLHFVDSQVRGPYRSWHHTHTFEPLAAGTLMRDRVLYEVPGGLLGKLILGGWVKADVGKIFKYRHKKIREVFPKNR